MKYATEISTRIMELKEKIRVIEEERNKELKKPFDKRNIRLLSFLYKEYSVYEFSMSQLEWVLSLNNI